MSKLYVIFVSNLKVMFQKKLNTLCEGMEYGEIRKLAKSIFPDRSIESSVQCLWNLRRGNTKRVTLDQIKSIAEYFNIQISELI